jgi:hypothetical protein
MKKTMLLIFCLAPGLILSAKAQTKPDPNFNLYILIGQSNMAGRGPITDDIKNEGNSHVYMFTRDSQWVAARHPVHFDKPSVAGAGPGLAFGIKMAEANPNVKIGLIPCAVGGTPIEHWVPGAYDAATKTHPYDDAVQRIKAAMKYGVIKGIIWHQGESNSSPEKAAGYLDKLTVLINRMRELAGNEQLPFIAGELGRYRPGYNNINVQLALLTQKVPYTGLATSEGLVHKGDTTHFDGKSADELGKRFATQMLKVQKQLPVHNGK